MAVLQLLKQSKSFGGVVQHFAHDSAATKSRMQFSVFLPPRATLSSKVPALYFLAGAARDEHTVLAYGGAQRFAAARGLALITPDTSPRVKKGSSHWCYGPGAGWYVDATEPRWAEHYKMHKYITQELPAVVKAELPIDEARQSILGHSMGGHGALMLALRNPDLYASVSAFAPACSATRGSYGSKALETYLGPDREAWRDWDATQLVLTKGPVPKFNILIDFGTEDEFWKEDEQLFPEAFEVRKL
ncbi:S-formylglutathione hydrolase [Achlya hypogyna]|uniref:S-formylglutathione hydrolase n=1 Tax=Achlya hypogyna TaxID=1202772 RepID=A0A1V9ZRT0_ACHHY|nr:S-formylglutathione hydrolase [Achlya hypogyna]